MNQKDIKMRKIIIPAIFLAILMLGSNQLVASAQENEFTITLNPGAFNSDSQNPMSPSANITGTRRYQCYLDK